MRKSHVEGTVLSRQGLSPGVRISNEKNRPRMVEGSGGGSDPAQPAVGVVDPAVLDVEQMSPDGLADRARRPVADGEPAIARPVDAGRGEADIGVRDGKFAAIGDLRTASAGKVIDAKGLHVLPGVIDTQVHFREPGKTYKEDLESGSRAMDVADGHDPLDPLPAIRVNLTRRGPEGLGEQQQHGEQMAHGVLRGGAAAVSAKDSRGGKSRTVDLASFLVFEAGF